MYHWLCCLSAIQSPTPKLVIWMSQDSTQGYTTRDIFNPFLQMYLWIIPCAGLNTVSLIKQAPRSTSDIILERRAEDTRLWWSDKSQPVEIKINDFIGQRCCGLPETNPGCTGFLLLSSASYKKAFFSLVFGRGSKNQLAVFTCFTTTKHLTETS